MTRVEKAQAALAQASSDLGYASRDAAAVSVLRVVQATLSGPKMSRRIGSHRCQPIKVDWGEVGMLRELWTLPSATQQLFQDAIMLAARQFTVVEAQRRLNELQPAGPNVAAAEKVGLRVIHGGKAAR